MGKRKINIIMTVIIIIALICAWIFLSDEDADEWDGKIHIPRNIQLEEGETINVVLPEFIVSSSTLSRETVYDLVMDIRENMEQEDVYANEDGTITVVLTQEQLENRIQMTEDSLINTIEKHDNIRIVINNKFNKAQYYVSNDCTLFEMSAVLISIRCCLVLAQIYSGIPHDKWKINEKIIYEDGNIVMFEFYLQEGGSWDISTSEWNAKMQELSEK